MQNHGLVGEINKGLGEAESQRPKAGPEAPDENERLHGGTLALLPTLIPDRHTFINQIEEILPRSRSQEHDDRQSARCKGRAEGLGRDS
jgi:hypothetical protein